MQRKEVKPKTICVPSKAASSSGPCEHKEVHHKGSSARYIRSTCKHCGLVWQEERAAPTKDPETCEHLQVDHRGSTKDVLRTYCKDCGTYIDVVSQELAKEMKAQQHEVTPEEQALFDRVVNHSSISKEQVVKAAEIMLAEARRLDAGSYSMTSVGNLFIDCADRALIIPTAMPATIVSKDALVAVHKDRQATHLRVVDPFNDPGIWAVVDDGCNSCCHSTLWHEDAKRKWRKLGMQSYLISSQPTKFNGVGQSTTAGQVQSTIGTVVGRIPA